MDAESGTSTASIFVFALIGLVVYGLVTYLVVKVAIVHALRSVLELASGRGRQKFDVKVVQNDLRAVAQLLRTDAVDD